MSRFDVDPPVRPEQQAGNGDPQRLGPLAPPPVCVAEPGDPPSGGGGLVIPGMEEALDIPAPSIEEEARRLHRENVEKDPYGYFRDLY